MAQVAELEELTSSRSAGTPFVGIGKMLALDRRHGLHVGLALAFVLLGACGKKEQPPAAPAQTKAQPAVPPAQQAKVYAVGTDASYPPFESLDERGEIVGFDVEVVQAIAKNVGIEVVFVNTPWAALPGALRQDDRDLVASAMTITAERLKALDFSDAYFDARQLIVVKVGRKVAGLADLQIGRAHV